MKQATTMAAARRPCRPATVRRRQRGFTLIEILVTFAVLAVMLGLAAPSFIAFQRNSELTSSANSFLAALSVARAEAMKRQLNAFVIPAVGEDWRTGWTVFVDTDFNNAFNPATDTLISTQPALPNNLVVNVASNGFADAADGNRRYAMFAGSGFMRLTGGGFQSGALQLTHAISGESRLVIANPAGRFRVCKPADAGCTASEAI